MSEAPIAYASVLRLNRTDIKTLNIHDAYSVHKVVFGLFSDIRSATEKNASVASGIIYSDKGGDFHTRQILMLSNRPPHQTPQFGMVETKPIAASFLTHERYGFEITLNPSKRDKQTGKVIPIRGRDAIAAWFISRAPISWGFSLNSDALQITQLSVQTFDKEGATVTHGSATLKGELIVTDRERFIASFTQGIGRGRAFGFGLLQIVPLSTP